MREHLVLLSEKVRTLKPKIKSEEATKQSMVLPLLQIVGYDIFDPEEVIPEVPCDISGKGDKVDYVISLNGKHEILIECKECHQNIYNYINQLKKYFVASDARLAILTNGIDYLFFTDHDKAHIMDEKPFYTLNIESLTEEDITFISGFSKTSFDSSKVLSTAENVICQTAIMSRIIEEINDPSKDFIDLLSADLHLSVLSDDLYLKYSEIIKDCFRQLLKPESIKNGVDVKEVTESPLNPIISVNNQDILNNIIREWLGEFETTEYKIQFRKLSNGYTSVDYGNRWWPVCRIKIRPKFDDKICVKICNGASVSNCTEIFISDIDDFGKAKDSIISQCSDSKERLFKYRSNKNV